MHIAQTERYHLASEIQVLESETGDAVISVEHKGVPIMCVTLDRNETGQIGQLLCNAVDMPRWHMCCETRSGGQISVTVDPDLGVAVLELAASPSSKSKHYVTVCSPDIEGLCRDAARKLQVQVLK